MIQLGSLEHANKMGYVVRRTVLGVFQIKSNQYIDVFRPNRCLYRPLSDFPTLEQIFTPHQTDTYWWIWAREKYVTE